jgi:hypothetical protein
VRRWVLKKLQMITVTTEDTVTMSRIRGDTIIVLSLINVHSSRLHLRSSTTSVCPREVMKMQESEIDIMNWCRKSVTSSLIA